MADISIIIVNFRGWGRLSQCLDSLSLIEDNRFSFEAIIVDNNSADGILDKFRQRYPKFTFILNAGNLGFANGCNLGANHSHGDYLLFLNPDTIVNAEALFRMFEEARERRPFSIVSCRQIRENGKEERPYGRFLSPSTLTGWLRAIAKIAFRKRQAPFIQTKEFLFPDWVSGSVVMISRKSFEGLGGWDDDFWMYFEDVDLCCRAGLKNGEVVLLKSVSIEHNHGGASRINPQITALTKTEVNISRHLYISKHEAGYKAFYMHLFLVVNNLLFGLFPAIAGILLFFVKSLSATSRAYFLLVSYYLNALRQDTWLSKKSVNYLKERM